MNQRLSMEIIKSTKKCKILDVGCGEGVLVEKYRKEGYSIFGIDIDYSSEHVMKNDIIT